MASSKKGSVNRIHVRACLHVTTCFIATVLTKHIHLINIEHSITSPIGVYFQIHTGQSFIIRSRSNVWRELGTSLSGWLVGSLTCAVHA